MEETSIDTREQLDRRIVEELANARSRLNKTISLLNTKDYHLLETFYCDGKSDCNNESLVARIPDTHLFLISKSVDVMIRNGEVSNKVNNTECFI